MSPIQSTPEFLALYAELRRVAGIVLRGARSSLTIQPTDLAHEYVLVFLESLPKTVDNNPKAVAEYAKIAFSKMRFMLLDHIRKHCRQRRRRVPMALVDGEGLGFEVPDFELFGDVLERLAAVDPDLAAVLQCRFFCDLTLDQTAKALGVSTATVERRQSAALSWIRDNVSPPKDQSEAADGD